MSTKFFTNQSDSISLFDKLEGIAQSMVNFDIFLAAVGYFRASGYFKIRRLLEKENKVKEIRILVGIDIDKLLKKHYNNLKKQRELFHANDNEIRERYIKMFRDDIAEADYNEEIENGILQFGEDLRTGRLQMRVHKTNNLHAKFYLCLPQNFCENTDGWVIMGSSNLSDRGLGTTPEKRYELNIALKDYDDVQFCKDEFEKLWKNAVDFRPDDFDTGLKQTHLNAEITPYEMYMKLLIEWFGNQVEDNFTLTMPDGYHDLRYQYDAAIQGFQMMQKHHGFILADVVGLGKTIVTSIVARRFLEWNGRSTNILVVCPPAIQPNWQATFKDFGLANYTNYVTNNSLDKVLNQKNNYRSPDQYQLIIVDEAHNYRHDNSQRFNNLQTICKSPCRTPTCRRDHKRVILISATPLNNRPDDLRNLLSLFQDTKRSTLDGVINLDKYFADINVRYQAAKNIKNPKELSQKIEEIYCEVRNDILKQITIRRTRHNLLNSRDYSDDLKRNHIIFPTIAPPNEIKYQLTDNLSKCFIQTVDILTNKLDYTRYRAIEHLIAPYNSNFNEGARQRAKSLAGIYKVNMIKRLESSFDAFKKSLARFLNATNYIIEMYHKDKVIILGHSNNALNKLQNDGIELDEILFKLEENHKIDDKNTYPARAFDKEFIQSLERDRDLLQELQNQWNKINEDPKLDVFIEQLNTALFDPSRNVSGKLVVFSESVDTVLYLYRELKKRLPPGKKNRILYATSSNREDVTEAIRKNFDANCKDDDHAFDILISSDVLSEGINLHRSNIIVNYDSPWNATRLMQRIGRVNRIGSKGNSIYNYMFYPSDQGDDIINLTGNALMKLQGFHSALGEDAQIFSHQEIVQQFELFNADITDEVDEELSALRQVRELYQTNRIQYDYIKNLPPKSRVARNHSNRATAHSTVAYIASELKPQFYQIRDRQCLPIRFEDAVRIFKAKIDEKPEDFSKIRSEHIRQVNLAVACFQKEQENIGNADSVSDTINAPQTSQAKKIVREWKRRLPDSTRDIDDILKSLDCGTYNQLPKNIAAIHKKYTNTPRIDEAKQYLQSEIKNLTRQFPARESIDITDVFDATPRILLSESFL